MTDCFALLNELRIGAGAWEGTLATAAAAGAAKTATSQDAAPALRAIVSPVPYAEVVRASYRPS